MEEIKCSHLEIKDVETFKCLWSKIVTNGTIKEEITERIKNTGSFCQLVRDILWTWEMCEKGNICLFKSYRAETWTLIKVGISRLMVVEMRFLKKCAKENQKGFSEKWKVRIYSLTPCKTNKWIPE
jgi:hypothetical protein